MDKEHILEVLHRLGFLPTLIDDDFGYSFEYEGLTLIYVPGDEDSDCLNFMLPAIFEITDDNRIATYEAMIALTGRIKYVQPFLMGNDSVWLAYQHYIGDSEVTEELVEHMVRVLAVSAATFHKIINEEKEENNDN